MGSAPRLDRCRRDPEQVMADAWNRRLFSLARFAAVVVYGSVALNVPAFAQAPGSSARPDHALVAAPMLLPAGAAVSPKFQYLFAQNARWRGPLRWKYNHANAPQALAGDPAAIVAQLQKSLDKWSSQCAVSYVYEGETTNAPTPVATGTGGPVADGVTVVGWGALEPTLGGFAYAWYTQDGADRVIIEADVMLNRDNVTTLAEVDRLVTHEWGHALGLDHSNTESAIMAGPPSTHYNALVTPQADDVRGCRCTYGLPAGASAPLVCSLPPKVEFGDAAVGAPAPTQRVTFTNSGNAPLSIQSSAITSAQFRHVGGCTPGTVVVPGGSCTLEVAATPPAPGPLAAQLALFTNDGYYELQLAVTGTAPSSSAQTQPSSSVEVIEYYNATLDHYFITWIAAEIANLDAGVTPSRWTRTGKTFKAYTTAQPGTSQICRFYIPPDNGNSHFFGRSAAECAASQSANPEFVLEAADYMHMAIPSAGSCAAGTRPVYRLFSNRADVNHRYTTVRAVRDQMVAAGWIAEGDGADLVAMCSPDD